MRTSQSVARPPRRSRLIQAIAAAALLSTIGWTAITLGGSPTDPLPAEKQAAFDRIAQDQAIGRSNPAPKQPPAAPLAAGPVDQPRFPNVATEIAGAGLIIESPMSPPGATNSIWNNLWQEQSATRSVGVYAGAVADDPQQGLVFWIRTGPAPAFADAAAAQLPTPLRAGGVRIIAARGEILTLQASDGTLFTFNAQAGTFK